MPTRLEADRAQAVADAVQALPFVAGLDGGRFGEVAMLFPRQRIVGLHEVDGGARLEVRVTIRADVTGNPQPLQRSLDDVRSAAVRALGPDAEGRAVDVILADVTPI